MEFTKDNISFSEKKMKGMVLWGYMIGNIDFIWKETEF